MRSRGCHSSSVELKATFTDNSSFLCITKWEQCHWVTVDLQCHRGLYCKTVIIPLSSRNFGRMTEVRIKIFKCANELCFEWTDDRLTCLRWCLYINHELCQRELTKDTINIVVSISSPWPSNNITIVQHFIVLCASFSQLKYLQVTMALSDFSSWSQFCNLMGHQTCT